MQIPVDLRRRSRSPAIGITMEAANIVPKSVCSYTALRPKKKATELTSSASMVVERNHLIHLASAKVCDRKDLNRSAYLLIWQCR